MEKETSPQDDIKEKTKQFSKYLVDTSIEFYMEQYNSNFEAYSKKDIETIKTALKGALSTIEVCEQEREKREMSLERD